MSTSLAQMICLLEEYRSARHGEPPCVKVTPGVLAEQWKAVLRDGGGLGRRGLVLWAATDAVVGETVLVHVLVVPDIPPVKDDR